MSEQNNSAPATKALGSDIPECLPKPGWEKSEGGGGVPIFYPTMEQFKDFNRFIMEIDKWGMKAGIVKVVPPKEWIDSLPALDEPVKTIKIKNPIVQHISGQSGRFRQQNIEKQKSYNIAQWKYLSEQPDYQPPAKRGESRKDLKKRKNSTQDDTIFDDFDYRFDDSEFTTERMDYLEKIYWKSIAYKEPMYGADMPGSLFGDTVKSWNVAHLDNLLNQLDIKIPGVNDAYLYCGLWKSTFAWHLEDIDLYSINYIHFGAPKQWYSINQEDEEKFYRFMANTFPEDHKACKEFLRHKTFLVSPQVLERNGISVNRLHHYQGEFVITFPYGYHAGYNLGYNCAESVNFATPQWVPIGKNAHKCMCISDSVGLDVEWLERRMLGLPSDSEHSDDDYHRSGASAGTPDSELDDIPTQKIHPQTKAKQSLQELTGGKGRIKKLAKPEEAKIKPCAEATRKLVKRKRQLECCLCPNEIPDFEILPLAERPDHTAHRVCANFIPETRVENCQVFGFASIPKDRLALKCGFCRSSRQGACIQCSFPKCVRAYHVTCADLAGVLCETTVDKSDTETVTIDYKCRFHRPKRVAETQVDLEISQDVYNFGYSLLPGDICQFQIGGLLSQKRFKHTPLAPSRYAVASNSGTTGILNGVISAGVVKSNNISEESVEVELLPHRSETLEVFWCWLLPTPTPSFGKDLYAQLRKSPIAPPFSPIPQALSILPQTEARFELPDFPSVLEGYKNVLDKRVTQQIDHPWYTEFYDTRHDPILRRCILETYSSTYHQRELRSGVYSYMWNGDIWHYIPEISGHTNDCYNTDVNSRVASDEASFKRMRRQASRLRKQTVQPLSFQVYNALSSNNTNLPSSKEDIQQR